MSVLRMYILVVFSLLEPLPTSCALEPIKCSEPTRVVIDIDEVNYTIPFGVCEDDSSSCTCSAADESLVITRAHLYSDGLEHDLQHRIEIFDVVLPEPGMGVGTYHYSVGCEYDCIPILYPNYCHGKSKEMELIVEVVDFELTFRDSEPPVNEVLYYANETDKKQKIMSGSNVTLSCLSGLNSSSNSTSLDLPVLFTFKAWSNDSVTKSVECSQSHMQQLNDGDWIITRQDSPPYDCLLMIINFGSGDVGRYSCAGLLPRDNSCYEAWSHTIIDLSIRELGSTYNEIVILVVVVAVVVVFLLLVIVGLVYRVKKVGRVPTSYTSLTRHRSLRQNYGATGSTGELSFAENASCTGTLVPSEASVPITNSEFWTDSNINFAPPTVPQSPSPNPENNGDPQDNGELLEESTPNSEGFTESEGQEGRKYYAQHAGIDQPDGRNTPKESNVPFDTNYTCKHCGKMYRQNQRLYYKRHIEHLEQRCPKFSQTECNKEHFDISVPPIGSRLGVSDMTFPSTVVPPAGNEDNRLQEPLEASGSDVNLHFLPESIGSSSNSGPPSTDPSTSSSGPSSSVGEEGQRIYNRAVHIELATGNTPESQFPIDPNYTCPKCGKEYHCDHRLYLVRHMNEDRCVSCCSGEQRNQSD